MGIGGGVNLGSASVFLYVDASQARNELRRYERDVENFQKKIASTANAISRSSTANVQMRNATSALDRLSTPTFVNAERSVASAVTDSQRVISSAYAERTRLFAQSAAQERAAAAIIKQAEEEKQAAIRMTARQQDLMNKLGVGTFAAGDPRLLSPGGRAYSIAVFELNDLITAYGNVSRQARIVADATARITTEQARLRAAAASSASAINRSYADQRRSVAAVQSAVAAQTNQYRSLAASSGVTVYSKIAADIEKSATRFVTSTNRMIDAQAKLERATQAKLSAERSGVGVTAARKAEENAARAVAQSAAWQQKSLKDLSIAQRNATIRAEAETAKRIAVANKEADAVTRAQREQEAARKQAAGTAIDNMMGSMESAAVGLVGSIVAVTNQAVSFEEQMYNVASISSEVADNLPYFTQNVQDLAVELGKSPTELAKGLYEITQAGFEGQEAFDLLALASKAAVAGVTTVDAAAKPLITTTLAYGYSIEEASSALDVLFAGVTEGIYSFSDLSEQLGDNLSLASTLGVPIQELSAAYVTLTKRSNSLAETTTQVNAIMNAFLKPSEALNAAVQEYTGQTAQAFFRTSDLGQVLALTNQLYQDNADSLGALFPNIRALRGVAGLTADEVSEFNKQLENMNNADGTTAAVLGKQMEAAAFQFRQAREQFRNAAIVLGNALIPNLLTLSNYAAQAAAWFSSLDESTQQLAGSILFWSAAAVTAVAVLNKLRMVILSTVRGMSALALAAGPVGLALTAIALIGGGVFLAYKKIEQYNKDLADSFSSLADAASTAADATQSQRVIALTLTVDKPSRIFEAAPDVAERFADTYQRIFDNAFKNVNAVEYVANSIDDLVTGAIDRFIISGDEAIKINQLMADSFGKAGDFADEYLDITEQMFLAHSAMVVSGDQIIRSQEGINAAFSNTKTLEEGLAVINLIQAAYDRFNEEKVRDPLFAAENLAASLAYIGSPEGRALIVKLGKDAQEANAAADDLAVAYEDVSSGVAQATQDIAELLKTITEGAMIASGALLDLSDPLAFIRQQMRSPDLTLLEALKVMEALNPSLGFDDLNTKVALDAGAALDFWTRTLAKATDALSAHTSRMGEYEQLSQEVSDLLGVEGDSLAYLDRYLREGLITQTEYNRIQEASIRLHDSAIVGREQEAAAAAKLIPELADYVEAYRLSAKSYEDLTPIQKGRIAALRDERNQTVLLTLVMAKLLEAMGSVKKGFTEDLGKALASGNDELGALLADFGLLGEQATIPVNIDVANAKHRLDEVNDQIANTKASLSEAVKFAAMTPSMADEILGPLQSKLTALTSEQRELILIVDAQTNGADAELHELALQIIADNERIKSEAEARKQLEQENTAATRQTADALEDAAQAAEAVRQAWADAWASIDPSAAMLKEMADQTIPELISSITPGLDDPLGYLFKGIPEAQRTIEQLILRAEELTGTPLNLEPWARQALLVKTAFDRTQAALQEVTDQIEESTSAIGQYEGYLSLVEDVIGSSTDTLSRYHKQLATGKITTKDYNEALRSGDAHIAYAELARLLEKGMITQDDYNRIVAAGESIRRSANRAILEENAARALAIPALDSYIKRHRLAEQGMRNLTDEQRGFIAALEDQNTQSALSNVLMIMSLEQVGAVARGTSARVVEAYRKMSPAFSAIAEDIGLIEGSRSINIDATVQASNTAQDAVDQSGSVVIDATVAPTTDASVVAATDEGRKAGESFADAFVSGIAAALSANTSAITNALDNRAIGESVGSRYVSSIAAFLASPTSVSAISDALKSSLAQLAAAADAGVLIGKAFVDGIAVGAEADSAKIERAATDAGKALVESGLEAIDARSPSRKGAYLGRMFVDGIVDGVEASTPGITTKGGEVGDELVAALDAVRGAGAPLWLEDFALQVAMLGESMEEIDPDQIRTLANEMLEFAGGSIAVNNAANALYDLANVAEANLATISSSGSEFSSNLTWVADQIAAYMGDNTPRYLVDMANELRELAESSDQLDADRIRNYAAALRSTGDASLAETARYLDVMASNIEERARRAKVQAVADAAAAARAIAEEAGPQISLGPVSVGADALDDLRDVIEQRSQELPDILQKYSKLSPDTVATAGDYLEAAIAGNVDGMIAEYDRLAQTLDRRTLDIIAATGAELAKSGLPRGWVLGPDYQIIRDMARIHDLAVRYLGSEAAAAAFLANMNLYLSDAYDSASAAATAFNTASQGTADQTAAVARGTMQFYPILSDAFGEGFAGLTADQQSAMVRFLRAFVTGNRDAATDAWSDVSSFMTVAGQQALIDLGWSLRGDGQQAGLAMTQGMTDGIASGTENATQAASLMANSVVGSVNKALGIASPSRVMAASGTNAALSFANAFLLASQRTLAQTRNAARSHVSAYGEELQRGMQQLSGGLSRPLDLFGSGALSSRKYNASLQPRVVTVSAPVTLGAITVQGTGDPAAVASEVRDRVWGELVDGIERIWAQVEGAV